MKYAALKKNDIANGPGIGVSFFTQGCPHHCFNCFNQNTWDFSGGYNFTPVIMQEILDALIAHGVQRHLSILGGEPLCPENSQLVLDIINTTRAKLPDTKIYIWTGYTIEELITNYSPTIMEILTKIDCLIDGPYIDEERDITLPMRGSRNQRIFYEEDLRRLNIYENM